MEMSLQPQLFIHHTIAYKFASFAKKYGNVNTIYVVSIIFIFYKLFQIIAKMLELVRFANELKAHCFKLENDIRVMRSFVREQSENFNAADILGDKTNAFKIGILETVSNDQDRKIKIIEKTLAEINQNTNYNTNMVQHIDSTLNNVINDTNLMEHEIERKIEYVKQLVGEVICFNSVTFDKKIEDLFPDLNDTYTKAAGGNKRYIEIYCQSIFEIKKLINEKILQKWKNDFSDFNQFYYLNNKCSEVEKLLDVLIEKNHLNCGWFVKPFNNNDLLKNNLLKKIADSEE